MPAGKQQEAAGAGTGSAGFLESSGLRLPERAPHDVVRKAGSWGRTFSSAHLAGVCPGSGEGALVQSALSTPCPRNSPPRVCPKEVITSTQVVLQRLFATVSGYAAGKLCFQRCFNIGKCQDMILGNRKM